MSLPDTKEQILQSHSGLIHRVVMHCNNPGTVPDLEQVLQMATENDWTALVAVIRDIMSGNRDESMLLVLDEVETLLPGEREGLFYRHDSDLIALVIDQAYRRESDSFVDAHLRCFGIVTKRVLSDGRPPLVHVL